MPVEKRPSGTEVPRDLRYFSHPIDNNHLRVVPASPKQLILQDRHEHDWTPPRTPVFQTDEDLAEEEVRTHERRERQEARGRFAAAYEKVVNELKRLFRGF